MNFDLPENAETYVHRVGRTGRAGRGGVAFTFVNETQRAAFEDLKRRAKVPFRQERVGPQRAAPQVVAPQPFVRQRPAPRRSLVASA